MVINLPIRNRVLLDPGTTIKYKSSPDWLTGLHPDWDNVSEGVIKEVIIELGKHIEKTFYRFVYILTNGKRVPEDDVVYPEYKKELKLKKKLI